jgi:tripartite-type tricarboxylate transporter receptor subunit TctC
MKFAGGGTDIVGRIIAQSLQEKLGQACWDVVREAAGIPRQ